MGKWTDDLSEHGPHTFLHLPGERYGSHGQGSLRALLGPLLFFLRILIKDLQDAVFKNGYVLIQYVDDLLVVKESCIADTRTLLFAFTERASPPKLQFL